MKLQMKLRVGDRVRVVTAESDYTGCRGVVKEAPSSVPAGPSGEPLGYYVAIDGENGRARPFLSGELERLRAHRAQPGARDDVLKDSR